VSTIIRMSGRVGKVVKGEGGAGAVSRDAVAIIRCGLVAPGTALPECRLRTAVPGRKTPTLGCPIWVSWRLVPGRISRPFPSAARMTMRQVFRAGSDQDRPRTAKAGTGGATFHLGRGGQAGVRSVSGPETVHHYGWCTGSGKFVRKTQSFVKSRPLAGARGLASEGSRRIARENIRLL